MLLFSFFRFQPALLHCTFFSLVVIFHWCWVRHLHSILFARKSQQLPSSRLHPPLPSGLRAWHPTVACVPTWLCFKRSGCIFFPFFYDGRSLKQSFFVLHRPPPSQKQIRLIFFQHISNTHKKQFSICREKITSHGCSSLVSLLALLFSFTTVYNQLLFNELCRCIIKWCLTSLALVLSDSLTEQLVF